VAARNDALSEETRMLVARVRERAGKAPGPDELADLLSAAASRRQMTTPEIRALGEAAISQAVQASYLLGKLAGLLGDLEGGPGAEGR
jgi:hypothetical protein